MTNFAADGKDRDGGGGGSTLGRMSERRVCRERWRKVSNMKRDRSMVLLCVFFCLASAGQRTPAQTVVGIFLGNIHVGIP